MSELTEIVDNLENRISKLLHKYEVLRQQNHSIHEELTAVKNENTRLAGEIESSLSQVQTLKAANAMLGSNDFKKETKLKINSLIREIDQCIVQLSE
jgi:regulator of replication initiation timing